jgi:hypothetical protein
VVVPYRVVQALRALGPHASVGGGLEGLLAEVVAKGDVVGMKALDSLLEHLQELDFRARLHEAMEAMARGGRGGQGPDDLANALDEKGAVLYQQVIGTGAGRRGGSDRP